MLDVLPHREDVMDHQIRDLERRARLEPALWPALVRARRRAWLPPVDLAGVVAEARKLDADLTAARAACAEVHGRLLVPFVDALFDEEQDLDLVVVSWWAAVREHVFVHVALDGPEVLRLAGAGALAGTRAERPRLHPKCVPWTFNLLQDDARERIRAGVLSFAPALGASGLGRVVIKRTRGGEVVRDVTPPWRLYGLVSPAVHDAAFVSDDDLRALALEEVGARAVALDDLLPTTFVDARDRRRRRSRELWTASEALGDVLEAQGTFSTRRADTLAATEDALARLGPALFEQHRDLTLAALVVEQPRWTPGSAQHRVLTDARDLAVVAANLREHGHDDLGLSRARGGGADRQALTRALEPFARLLAGTPCLIVLERLADGHVDVRRGPWPAGF